MSTQYVDFAAYGVANLTFTLYVGDTPGYRSIEARINWSNRGSETNNSNNSVATSINVRDFDYEMSVDDVTMSGNYCAGETVISSFTVSNDSDYDITPDIPKLSPTKPRQKSTPRSFPRRSICREWMQDPSVRTHTSTMQPRVC